ncbi:hypothetical protein SPBR_07942 [Sporothrix brasiliensis 5110]|uniref:Uncharacterized protein n=1 Tax=Sporothrix brasiliensis 5110 TaxID=1398154 RepID=A0A0C2ERM2_9PEZI|nr:uncharacterized protein SPBR_07942 [Sporothrix brasiliensis 5110]KIH89019.1 hypothetical protein SPBR_07942 [Sporothrix brasiliensis 5110]
MDDVEDGKDGKNGEDKIIEDVENDVLLGTTGVVENSSGVKEDDNGEDDEDNFEAVCVVIIDVSLLAEPPEGTTDTVLLDTEVVFVPGLDDGDSDDATVVWLETGTDGVGVEETSTAGTVALDVTLEAGCGVTVGESDDWEEVLAGAVAFVEVEFDTVVVCGSDE